MADKNLITYDELAKASKQYKDFSQSFADAKKTLQNLNNTLANAWANDTATAYYEAFTNEYGPALLKVSEALQSIACTIDDYTQKVKELDNSGANAFKK
ncbi:MAG: WXG100 family type VII secretion target [Lachnospiraceae bacterium]|nr:WXG100 family type VII secretion target [Lachnospiraceae bacterium]